MAPAAYLRLLSLSHLLLVVLSHPREPQSLLSPTNTPLSNPPSNEELSTSLVINQLAILQMMQDVSNASCAVQEIGRQQEARVEEEGLTRTGRVLVEALRLQMERVEAEQRRTHEFLEAISTKIGTSTQGVTELRDMMQGELERSLEVQQKVEAPPPPPSSSQLKNEALHYATLVHNDTVPSLCLSSLRDKFLLGSIGALEVVSSGLYDANQYCMWHITLPVRARLRLTWEYIETERHKDCIYDFVKVEDVANGKTSVYGRPLCGSLSNSALKMLNVVLPPTDKLLVTFKSDGSSHYRGFKLNYQVQQDN